MWAQRLHEKRKGESTWAREQVMVPSSLSLRIMGREHRRGKLCNMRKYIHKTLSAFAYLWQVNAYGLAGV